MSNNEPEYLDDTDPEKNLNYWRQDHGGMVTKDNGVADRLLTNNNELYNRMKGDWTRTSMNKGNNIKVTTGRKDGKFFITREQQNIEAIKQHVVEYRLLAEAGVPDPLAPLMPDGTLGYKWMELPQVISIRICDQYFGGTPWHAIKTDRTMKAQFYSVVQREYPEYVCYPGGKLPIPVAVSYPNRTG